MKKALLFLLFVFFLAGIIFIIGPRPHFDEIQYETISIPDDLLKLDGYVAEKESKIKALKSDNQARIIWADSLNKSKTKYSIVYLHGFSASQGEASPLHQEFARRFNCNLYLSRLADCGMDTKDSFKEIQPRDFIMSANEAIDIGKRLGDSLIIIAGSTGASYATYLAGGDNKVAGLIFYSPNIDLFDSRSDMMLWPWGKKLTEYLLGGEYRKVGHNEKRKKYWTDEYHIDGLIAMKYFLNENMNPETFSKINQPLFIGCYYKDETNQDKVVSVSKMRDFYNEVSTEDHKKWFIEFPDAGNHVICSPLWSNDLSNVRNKTFEFAEKIIGLVPQEKLKKDSVLIEK